MSEFFEVGMVLCFGISWPISIYKSYTSRSNEGKSIVFVVFILIGYVFGVTSKLLAGNITYVVYFYIINLLMVSFDFMLYFRNRKIGNYIQV